MGLLLLLAGGDLAAQKKACSLLSAGEINASLTGQVGEPHQIDLSAAPGASKNKQMDGCMWKVGQKGMVSIGIMVALQGQEREAGMAKMRGVYDALKAKHWTEEKKVFDNGSCAVMTPPASEAKAPIMSGCLAEAKGMAVSVTYLDPQQKLTPDKAKALLDKVLAHL
jgi:hypothetical protein